MKKFYMLILLTLLSFGLAGCQTKQVTMYYPLDVVFGDLLPQVWIIAPQKLFDDNPDLSEELSAITNELDAIYSTSKSDSLITEVNKNAGIKPVKVTQEFIDIIKEAKAVSILSEVDGVALYDISIAPVVDLWDINNLRFSKNYEYNEIPEDKDIQKLLPLVNYKNIIIDEENLTVFLKEEGMKIELGSILKGYAADKIKDFLHSKGFKNALINVSGNLYVLGQNYSKSKFIDWEISIQVPYAAYGAENTFGSVIYNDVTAVTSGSYERYILTKEGKQYHHILDPRTGYPNDNDILSVTIFTKKSIRADALSTATFSLGLDKGYDLIESLEETEAVFLTNDYKVYITSGLQDKFTFNEKVTKEMGYEYKGVKNGTSN